MAQPSSKLKQRYNDTHWGVDGKAVWEVDDPDLPDELCEMGKLVCLEGEDDEGAFQLDFSKKASLCFDLDSSQTLYCLLTPADRRAMKGEFRALPGPVESLSAIARQGGGRQAGFRQPSVRAKIVGTLTKVYYKCEKKGDGFSTYVHTFGEESGVLPLIAVDAKGRVWIVAGDYTVPDGGITN